MVQFSLAAQRNNCDLNLYHNLFELSTEAVEISKSILVEVKYLCTKRQRLCSSRFSEMCKHDLPFLYRKKYKEL